MTRRIWTEAEYVVLVGIFSNFSFNMGDDEKPLCRDIAKAFGRNPGTIDRQWRNINDILKQKNVNKIGSRLVYWTTAMLGNPSKIRALAQLYCDENGWKLASYLEDHNEA